MSQGYDKLFASLAPAEPPAGLVERVLERVVNERRRAIHLRHVALLSVGSLASVAVLALAVRSVGAGFVSTGLSDLLALIVTDTAAVAANWRDFAFAALERLPVGGFVLTLAAALALMESIKYLVQDIRRVMPPSAVH